MTKEDAVAQKGAWDTDKPQTIYNIAAVKAYNYCEEYNPYTGRTEQKKGYLLLKEGYIAGFLAGFTHKFTGDKDVGD
jgi:hypothetical protein